MLYDPWADREDGPFTQFGRWIVLRPGATMRWWWRAGNSSPCIPPDLRASCREQAVIYDGKHGLQEGWPTQVLRKSAIRSMNVQFAPVEQVDRDIHHIGIIEHAAVGHDFLKGPGRP